MNAPINVPDDSATDPNVMDLARVLDPGLYAATGGIGYRAGAEQPRRHSRRAVDRRRAGALWSVFDQVLSSFTNFALTIVVAHYVSARSFGAFSLVFGTFLFVTPIVRSIASEPLLVLYSATSDERRDRESRAAMAVSISLGALAALILSIAGVLSSGDVSNLLLICAVCIPGLELQDNVRYVLINSGRARAACLNDAIYGAVQLSLAAILISTRHASVISLAASWAVVGAGMGVVGIWQVGMLPNFKGVGRWLSTNRRFWVRYMGEAISSQAGIQIVLYAVTGIAGLPSGGAFRAADTLYKPAYVLTAGARVAMIPNLSRRRSDRRSVVRHAQAIAMVLGAVTLLLGIPVMLLPNHLGEVLLGQSWAPARPLLPYALIAQTSAVLVSGAMMGLRGLADPRRSFSAQTTASTFYLAGGLIGAFASGALGAAIGLAIAQTLQIFVAWRLLIVSSRQTNSGVPYD